MYIEIIKGSAIVVISPKKELNLVNFVYRKRSWTMLKYGLIRGKIRTFDRDNEFVD
jgi:hypothetical protein